MQFIASQNIVIADSYFKNNIAEDKTSGIFFYASDANITGSTFEMSNIN
jgi:hypothetical protein